MKNDNDWVLNQALARELLVRKFGTQTKAAEAMGIARPGLTRTLSSTPNATIAVIGRIADALGVGVQSLLIREGELRAGTEIASSSLAD